MATGKATASKLFEVRDLLQIHRVASVSARLIKEFEWSALPGVNPQAIASVHKSIRALGDLHVAQLFFQLQHDDSFVLGAVRHLNEVWSELRSLVEAENVELNIAPVQLTMPIVKPKPTQATMNAALVAA